TDVSGDLEAESVDMAKTLLSNRGYIPVDIKETSFSSSGGGSFIEMIRLSMGTVKITELIVFIKQFRTMLRAGISIITLLNILKEQTENPKLKYVVTALSEDIKEGLSLHEAFKKHSNVFSPLFCSMIRAGELSGSVPEVMERLIYITEHEHRIRSDIKSAMRYPMIVTVFLFVAFIVLLTFVIPKFVNIFLKARIDLPIPTKIAMNMYQFLISYWHLMLLGIVGTVVFFIYYFKTDQGRYVRDVLILKIPIIGPLLLKASMSRFASIFSILQSSGVAVLESMSILAGTIGNAAIMREFERISKRLTEGTGISAPLKSSGYFPPMVVNMIAIGEETGNLEEMLKEIASHYDAEVEYGMKALSEAIGPILTVGLTLVVGFFALAIFLPMWDLTKMVK
ncbi:MAG: type II secretion system F family protein, partial [Desulfobacterales bacterium]|nr:type II secretion system F family protein [Desulfobacterales bacterium]